MHIELTRASASLELPLPNLQRAGDWTEAQLSQASDAAKEALTPQLGTSHNWSQTELDLVICGSVARQEMSEASDFDYVIMAYKLVHDPDLIPAFRKAAEAAMEKIGAEPPGPTGTFGGLVSASELVDLIGLERDTNRSITQRLLLLEESVPLLSEASHHELVRAVLQRYLYDYRNTPDLQREKRGVPRFLLNDVIRYYRTLAVDYQAKRWRDMGVGEGWGSRYIKLRSMRKTAFAGTLVALLLPRITDELVTVDLLSKQFGMPPLARLAQLHRYFEAGTDGWQHLRNVLETADYFVGKFGDENFRRELDLVEALRTADPEGVFHEARQRTEDLQDHLARLFTCRSPLEGAPPIAQGTGDKVTLGYLSERYLFF